MKQATLYAKDDGCLCVDGAITFYNASQLCDQLAQVMPQNSEHVTVELAKLSDCDSAGLVFLIMLLRQAKSQEKTVRFKNIPRAMHALIKLYNLTNIIHEVEVAHG